MAALDDLLLPINAESTAGRLARHLRIAFERGGFEPGEQLIETELARRFAVSRGVLREALQRLTQEGLVVAKPNRGVFVAEFDADDIFDIYTVRLALERAACLKVVDTTDRAESLADALTLLNDEFEAVAASGADPSDVTRLDVAFHERLIAEAQSPRLTKIHETLATESRMCLATLESRLYALDDRIAEHRAITDAIRARDVPSLNTLLAEHMDHAVATIVRQLPQAKHGAAASPEP